MTKDFIRVERFRLIKEKIHTLKVSPKEMSEFYLSQLLKVVELEPGALEVCQELSQMGKIIIVTNGIQTTQVKRLANSGLLPYIDEMVTSEECGFAKPDSRFFAYAMKKIGEPDTRECLLIGDRIETDILGANLFGIDSCWYNPKKAINKNSKIRPKYEIKSLSQVKML